MFHHVFLCHIAQLVVNNLGVFLYLSFPSGIRILGNIRRQYVHQFWRLFTHGVTSSSQLTPTSAWLDWHLSIIFAPELTVIFACLQEYIDMRMYEDHLYINFDKTSGTMPSKSGSANPHESAMWHKKVIIHDFPSPANWHWKNLAFIMRELKNTAWLWQLWRKPQLVTPEISAARVLRGASW